jgi:hypothetical protein
MEYHLAAQRSPFAVVAALTLAMTSSLAIAGPAHAATVCNPVIYKYEVREAGAGIGLLHVKTNVCTSGTTVTSSSGSVTWEPNPLGTATGWVYTHIGTSRTATSAWLTSGSFKLCVPTQLSPLCSYGEAFKVAYAGYPKAFVGPTMQPRFTCTNTYCSSHMTFVYKGRG